MKNDQTFTHCSFPIYCFVPYLVLPSPGFLNDWNLLLGTEILLGEGEASPSERKRKRKRANSTFNWRGKKNEIYLDFLKTRVSFQPKNNAMQITESDFFFRRNQIKSFPFFDLRERICLPSRVCSPFPPWHSDWRQCRRSSPFTYHQAKCVGLHFRREGG